VLTEHKTSPDTLHLGITANPSTTTTEMFILPKDIFKMARQLVCTPATSVPAECAFSISAYVGRKERARLSVKNLSTTMFLKVSFQNIYYVALLRFVTIIRSQ
jgi:hypothetical protein